jgi:hypothetical protein
MKKNKLQVSFGILRVCFYILLIAVLTNCTGPEGPAGAPGYNGKDGLDGINYNRSVIYDVDPADWDGGPDGYFVNLEVPEITDDIYYNGAVLVYRLVEIEPNSFNMLPYTWVDNALTRYMDFDVYVGSIDLIYKEVLDGMNYTPAPEVLMSFKIVIIEGIPLATLKTKVNVEDYNAVARMFNIDKVPGNIQ